FDRAPSADGRPAAIRDAGQGRGRGVSRVVDRQWQAYSHGKGGGRGVSYDTYDYAEQEAAEYEACQRQAEYESQRAESDLPWIWEQQRRESMRRYGKESARRRKLFARACVVLVAAARVRGRSGDLMVLGLTRSGVPSGQYVDIGP